MSRNGKTEAELKGHRGQKESAAVELYSGSEAGRGNLLKGIETAGSRAILRWKIPAEQRSSEYILRLAGRDMLFRVWQLSLIDVRGNRKELREKLGNCSAKITQLYDNFYLMDEADAEIHLRGLADWMEMQLDIEFFRTDARLQLCLMNLKDEIENDFYEEQKKRRKLEEKHKKLKEKYSGAKQECDVLKLQALHYQEMNTALLNSLCWRIMAPIRWVMDIFSQHYLRRAVLCVHDHGLKYTMELYRSGGYKKDNLDARALLSSEEEYKGRIIDFFKIGQAELDRQKNYRFSKEVKFSVLVPLYNTDPQFLREMIESVQYQTYQNWELCLADGSGPEYANVGEICRSYAEKDSRILYKKLEKNEGISGNTNACIDMSAGDYISLFDHDDILHPCALFETMRAITEKNADFVYTDEAVFIGRNISNINTWHCKPDFAVDTLRANNYICHFSSFRRSLLDRAGRFRSEYDGSQDHDLILRLTELAENICHIPKVLYYWRSHSLSVAQDIHAKTYAIASAKKAVESHLERVGLEGEVQSTKAFPTIFQINYRIVGNPRISIIIPSRDHVDSLSKCLTSIMTRSGCENYEILVVDNNSVEEETRIYYEMAGKLDKVKVVCYKEPFSYAEINNWARQYAAGDYLLFLHNDTEVISRDWMEQLLMYAQRDDVGAVGAKLYTADNTIQHAGIVLGLGRERTAGFIHSGVDRNHIGYMGQLCYAQDMSAVSGACLMVAAAKFDEVGGFDESFGLTLGDVDFCLRLRQKQYLNVFTPFAELYHYEGKTWKEKKGKGRLKAQYEKEAAFFKKKWKKELEAGDPYFNPNFSLERTDYFYVGTEEDW